MTRCFTVLLPLNLPQGLLLAVTVPDHPKLQLLSGRVVGNLLGDRAFPVPTAVFHQLSGSASRVAVRSNLLTLLIYKPKMLTIFLGSCSRSRKSTYTSNSTGGVSSMTPSEISEECAFEIQEYVPPGELNTYVPMMKLELSNSNTNLAKVASPDPWVQVQKSGNSALRKTVLSFIFLFNSSFPSSRGHSRHRSLILTFTKRSATTPTPREIIVAKEGFAADYWCLLPAGLNPGKAALVKLHWLRLTGAHLHGILICCWCKRGRR